ncbi:MAG TPA: hypothetical protein VHO67_04685 [Polyangia bacterium]|nr:hypothetical protein [Polyangia bacterium]
MQLTAEVQAADARVRELREAKARVDADRRLALFQSLRRAGLSMAAAMDEVERRDRAGALDQGEGLVRARAR